MELTNVNRRVHNDYVNTKINQPQHGVSHSSHIYTVPNSSQSPSKERHDYTEIEGFKRRLLERLKKRQICVVFAILALLIISVVAIAVVVGIHILKADPDGPHSSWLEWSSCDVPCGKCKGPSLSGGGQDCHSSGTSDQTQKCPTGPCAETNGGWSGWSVWTNCSATCDTGVQTRQRHCNNPLPSSGGQYCEGSPMDVVHCNIQHCPRVKSSFTATGATRLSNGILSFSSVLLNEGSNFNGSSGTFTCQLSGLYFFTASIFEGGTGVNSVFCYIRRNDYDQVGLWYWNARDSTNKTTHDGYGAATGSATLHLTNGDRVHVWCDMVTSDVTLSSFTGFLIAEDP